MTRFHGVKAHFGGRKALDYRQMLIEFRSPKGRGKMRRGAPLDVLRDRIVGFVDKEGYGHESIQILDPSFRFGGTQQEESPAMDRLSMDQNDQRVKGILYADAGLVIEHTGIPTSTLGSRKC